MTTTEGKEYAAKHIATHQREGIVPTPEILTVGLSSVNGNLNVQVVKVNKNTVEIHYGQDKPVQLILADSGRFFLMATDRLGVEQAIALTKAN